MTKITSKFRNYDYVHEEECLERNTSNMKTDTSDLSSLRLACKYMKYLIDLEFKSSLNIIYKCDVGKQTCYSIEPCVAIKNDLNSWIKYELKKNNEKIR